MQNGPGNGDEPKLCLTLTKADRALLTERTGIPAPLVDKLRFGVVEGDLLSFTFTREELDELARCAASEANHAGTKKKSQAFSRIWATIEDLLKGEEPPGSQGPSEEDFRHLAESLPRSMPPEMREAIQARFQACQPRNIDEANAVIMEVVNQHNRRGRPEFAGLSPEQLMHLLHADPSEAASPIQINKHLPYEAVKDAFFYRISRAILLAVLEEDGVKATPKGNLNRDFVRRMLETQEWPPKSLVGYMLERGKLINEEDVQEFHVPRVVLTAAGLLRKYKGALRVPKKWRHLTEEGEAGALFAKLFEAYFWDFNLAYRDHFVEAPSLQSTFPFSLFVIGRHAADWQSPEVLAQRIFLPVVIEEILGEEAANSVPTMAKARIVRPLEEFGLVELKYDEEGPNYFWQSTGVRKTPLFDQFITFDLA